jgi:hypothetical protein
VRDEPSLAGGTRPLLLRGMVPAEPERSPPLVLIAASSTTPSRDYDRLLDALARHGCAAFVVERFDGPTESGRGREPEPWWRYADAIAHAAWQLRAEARSHAVQSSSTRGELDADGTLLVAHGDGAAAAARAAAQTECVRGVALLDAEPAGPALAWIARSQAPLLVVASNDARADASREWFVAGGAPPSSRWLVEISGSAPLAPTAPASSADPIDDGSFLERDVDALIVHFADARLAPPDLARPSTAEFARHGFVDRVVTTGDRALAPATPRTPR